MGSSVLQCFTVLALIIPTLTLANEVSSNKETVVVQKNKFFSTKEIRVRLGDTIVFRNEEDDVLHNVYSITPGAEFEIAYQKPGTQASLVLDAKKFHPGTMIIECAIHPTMKLTVTILDK